MCRRELHNLRPQNRLFFLSSCPRFSLKSFHNSLPHPLANSVWQGCQSRQAMESLADTLWDVVIYGTGLKQSLLAL